MNTGAGTKAMVLPAAANFVSQGAGAPVVLVHGLAASLHDWDALVPVLVRSGYSTYAVDLLGHGDSPKPPMPLYRMDWLVEHFAAWLNGLVLPSAPVLIGHSLGGYVVLEYARRFPERVRGLVVVDPYYTGSQLPLGARLAYAHPGVSSSAIRRAPAWLVRRVIDVTSVLMGHSTAGLHALPEAVRAQAALDYMRTAPGVYGVLQKRPDLTPHLESISTPTLVLWGRQDRTLAPGSFGSLVRRLPHAIGDSRATGHLPHQAEPEWFHAEVLSFLGQLPQPAAQPLPTPAG